MKLVFATNNQHKVEEIKAVLPQRYSIITLKEAGLDIDIPEPYETLAENAAEKARVIYRITRVNCFSEDTGLEVDVLNGEPGVRSARYAGDEKAPHRNIEKLLNNLKEQKNRKAQFRAVICLILNGKEHFFEGICRGTITEEPHGNEGFGYDPVFVPDGADKTFAQMNLKEKNEYNHRRKAADKLVAFLNRFNVN